MLYYLAKSKKQKKRKGNRPIDRKFKRLKKHETKRNRLKFKDYAGGKERKRAKIGEIKKRKSSLHWIFSLSFCSFSYNGVSGPWILMDRGIKTEAKEIYSIV